MSGGWPFPGDSPLTQLRRIAMAYRHLAEQADQSGTAMLDARMIAWGHSWIVPQWAAEQIDPQEWLRPARAAELALLKPDSLAALRRRGRLPARKVGRHYEFQAGEILKLRALRERGRTVTDTIGASGSSLPAEGTGA